MCLLAAMAVGTHKPHAGIMLADGSAAGHAAQHWSAHRAAGRRSCRRVSASCGWRPHPPRSAPAATAPGSATAETAAPTRGMATA